MTPEVQVDFVKLVVWDLDDTLWQGTLSESTAQSPLQIHSDRVQVIRDLWRQGVVHSICSKNDYAAAKEKLQALGLWDLFVFPKISWSPKGEQVALLLRQMRLRPQNTLFVDDNPTNLAEVQFYNSGIQVLNALSEEAGAVLANLRSATAHVRKSRLEQYRLLERKVKAEEVAASNLEFLKSSETEVFIERRLANLKYKSRILELVNRSNQLNYFKSRYASMETLTEEIVDTGNKETFTVFVKDRFGEYGLVGFICVDLKAGVEVFTFSCRILHMGVERYVVDFLKEYYKTKDWLFEKLESSLKSLETGDFIRPMSASSASALTSKFEQPSTFGDCEPTIQFMMNCQSAIARHYLPDALSKKVSVDAWPESFSALDSSGRYRLKKSIRLAVYGLFVDFGKGSDICAEQGLEAFVREAHLQNLGVLLLGFTSKGNPSPRFASFAEDISRRYENCETLLCEVETCDAGVDLRHISRSSWRSVALQLSQRLQTYDFGETGA